MLLTQEVLLEAEAGPRWRCLLSSEDVAMDSMYLAADVGLLVVHRCMWLTPRLQGSNPIILSDILRF